MPAFITAFIGGTELETAFIWHFAYGCGTRKQHPYAKCPREIIAHALGASISLRDMGTLHMDAVLE